MKKILPLLFFAALFAALDVVQAQSEYHPIADGCSWSVSNEKYMTAGDTVLDGKTYLKVYRRGESSFAPATPQKYSSFIIHHS